MVEDGKNHNSQGLFALLAHFPNTDLLTHRQNILMKAENGIIRKDFWQVFNLPSTVAGDIEDGFSVSLVISSAVTSSSEFVPLEKFDNMPRSDIHIGREQITARSRRLYRDERKGRRGYWVDFYVLISIEIAMDLHIKIRSATDGMPPKARHVKTTSRSPMRDPMDVPFADLQDFPVKTLYDQRTDLTYIWAVEERNAQAEQSSQRGSSISLWDTTRYGLNIITVPRLEPRPPHVSVFVNGGILRPRSSHCTCGILDVSRRNPISTNSLLLDSRMPPLPFSDVTSAEMLRHSVRNHVSHWNPTVLALPTSNFNDVSFICLV